MYAWNSARCEGSSGRVSRNTTNRYAERKPAFRLYQLDVVSKLKLYFAAISGNHRPASWTKLICAGSCLAVKNAITLNAGLPSPGPEQQYMRAAMLNALRRVKLISGPLPHDGPRRRPLVPSDLER